MSATRETIVIDPTETQNPEHKTLLDKQLCSETSKLGFAANASYGLQLQNKDNNIDTIFTHTIIHRPCKKPVPNQHFEVVGNKMGEGRSSVYSILGTLKKTNSTDTKSTFEFKDRTPDNAKGNKERVVKAIDMTETDKEQVQCEYELTQRAPHIGMKPPGIFQTEHTLFSCSVMNRLPGKDLYDIISNDFEDIDVLTTDQRIDLGIALLEALDQQVHKKGMVHRDIKPENIKVFLSTDKIIVNIFDFDLSKLSHEQDKDLERVGTLPYISPEMIESTRTTFKSDIHAMALILSLIFRAAQREECVPYNDVDMLNIINEHEFNYLFDGIYDLSPQHQDKIEAMIKGMYDVNPETRWTIHTALEELKEIKAERVVKNKPCVMQ